MKLTEIRPGLWAHPAGALWLPGQRAGVIADVHLGYGWAMRRRGQLGPVASAGVGERLQALLEDLRPQRLVVLGDLVHAPRPGEAERAEIERGIAMLRERTGLLLVRGNHDRGLARDFPALGLPAASHWDAAGWRAIHGDAPMERGGCRGLILGHFHPAVSVQDAAGARLRVPAFLVFPGVVVLPAFSPFAAGFDARRGIPAALRALTGGARPELWAAAGSAVLRVG